MLLAELRDALAAGHVHNHYQPVVRIADRQPLGLEVLARLDHPQRGTLAPGQFVPQIEDAGLAFQLAQAVVRRAFADWDGAALERLDLWLALNFPLDVLLLPETLTWLDERRRAAGIPVERLGIELTESRPVVNAEDLGRAVTALRQAGYTLVIDDVGPGVRDADQLLGLGFSVLKLDMGLVHASRDDPAMAARLDTIVAAAHAAGLLVVAEGVEDAATWQRMQAASVEQAQGFLIARPMAADAVADWHRAWRGANKPPA